MWIEVIEKHNKNIQITKNSKVCSKHFLKSMFMETFNLPRLNMNAVPTIFGENKPKSLPISVNNLQDAKNILNETGKSA